MWKKFIEQQIKNGFLMKNADELFLTKDSTFFLIYSFNIIFVCLFVVFMIISAKYAIFAAVALLFMGLIKLRVNTKGDKHKNYTKMYNFMQNNDIQKEFEKYKNYEKTFYNEHTITLNVFDGVKAFLKETFSKPKNKLTRFKILSNDEFVFKLDMSDTSYLILSNINGELDLYVTIIDDELKRIGFIFFDKYQVKMLFNGFLDDNKKDLIEIFDNELAY